MWQRTKPNVFPKLSPQKLAATGNALTTVKTTDYHCHMDETGFARCDTMLASSYHSTKFS